MIEVQFFASLRERLGYDRLELECRPGDTLARIRERLARQEPEFARASQEQRLLAAVNETLAQDSQPVADGDRLAFFPPVTGG